MVSTPKHLAQVIVNQLNFLPPSYWGDPTPLSMDIIYIHLYTSFHHNILGCSHPSQFVTYIHNVRVPPSISDSFDLYVRNQLVPIGLNLIIVSIPVPNIYIHLYTDFLHNILGCSHPSQFVTYIHNVRVPPSISDSFDLLCSKLFGIYWSQFNH